MFSWFYEQAPFWPSRRILRFRERHGDMHSGVVFCGAQSQFADLCVLSIDELSQSRRRRRVFETGLLTCFRGIGAIACGRLGLYAALGKVASHV